MKRAFVGLLFSLLAGSAQAQPVSIELDRYTGLWYELARTPNRFQDNTPEVDGARYSACFASTASYEPVDDNTLRIHNACQRVGPDGEPLSDDAHGLALVEPGSNGTRLRIAFGSRLARFFQRAISLGGFPYWIYDVGPPDAEGRYRWSLVSNPDRDYLFILTRSLDMTRGEQEQILDRARGLDLPVGDLVFRGELPADTATR